MSWLAVLLSFRLLFWALLAVAFCCLLDEECNPGWGDCGPPLQIKVMLDERLRLVLFCSVGTGHTAHRALCGKTFDHFRPPPMQGKVKLPGN